VSPAQLVPTPLFNFANTNRFVGVETTDEEPSPFTCDYEAPPVSIEDNNRAIVSSNQISVMERPSPASNNFDHDVPLSSQSRYEECLCDNSPTHPSVGDPQSCGALHAPNVYENEDLRQFIDKEHLANLPDSVLKEALKNVTEALKNRKNPSPRRETASQVRERKTLQTATSRFDTIKGVFTCEHPGCKTTFRRNKDRLRHIRQKYATTEGVFSCPIVDCPAGFGHQYHRSDKLRDHLRGQRVSSYQWTCILPGCFEIASSRTALLDHLGQHDYNTRRLNNKLLTAYGFSGGYYDYLMCNYICSVRGCPFGTDDKAVISSHLSIPHNGPFCPCPVSNCGEISKDWQSASSHFLREHDYITRQSFSSGSPSYQNFFVCPICHHEIQDANKYNVRDHCQTHDYQQRLRSSQALLNAWTFSFGPEAYIDVWRNRDCSQSREAALAYIILPPTEFKKLRSNEDLDQAGLKLRTAFELSKDMP